jgi:catechol 2,3-dioxygenase-like lactoylglutathione lyase family enzyme
MPTSSPALIPELLCFDLVVTKAFYVDVLGSHVAYERPEETFVYLTRDGCDVMFEQLDGPGRRWITGPLERPLGRGVNLQIRAREVAALDAAVRGAAPASVYVPLEDKGYRCGTRVLTNRPFVAKDPDGYLLRFAEGTEA